MQERTIKFTPVNVIFYLLGFLLTALGVIFMIRSDLGAGPWDTVTANLNAFLESVNFSVSLGFTSMSISITIFLVVLLYTKKIKLIGMLLPILLMGFVIDFWDIAIFGDYYPDHNVMKLLFYIAGALCIPLGLSFVINSNFPAFVFDELTIALMHLFKTENIVRIRLFVEFTGISLGILFGFLAGIGFGSVNIGSTLLAAVLPYLLKQSIKLTAWIKKQELFLQHTRNVILYAMGGAVISFAVVLMLRSELGLSTWDTLHYALHKLTGIEIGTATIYVAVTFTIMVIILNRNFKYLFMLIPIFSVGWFINVVNLQILVDYEVNHIVTRTLSYTAGLLMLPLGGSLMIVSTYPAGVFDEFNLAVMKVLRTDKLVQIRVIMEITAVITAIIISLIAGAGIGMFNVGTLIFALSVGFLLKRYLVIFERIGIYENKQND